MRLFLVDSNIYIYKAWFGAKHEMLNADQHPNQAFIGFTDFVYRLLAESAPQKLVFAFDQGGGKSERKTLYSGYKANRNPTPFNLRRQFDWCQQWVEQLGISKVSHPEWEADDLIGTLAQLHRSPELSIVILTADKDLTQLVREGDICWTFFDDKKLDYNAIRKKFKVKPEQIADQLALTGDKVDNIPGIPLVGLKTAASLLRKYGDLKTLRANLHEVGKMKFRYAALVQRSLIDNESILDISSALTQINCHVESMREVSISRGPANVVQLQQMMDFHQMDSVRVDKWQTYLQTNCAEPSITPELGQAKP
jgi:DNA polymerase-1